MAYLPYRGGCTRCVENGVYGDQIYGKSAGMVSYPQLQRQEVPQYGASPGRRAAAVATSAAEAADNSAPMGTCLLILIAITSGIIIATAVAAGIAIPTIMNSSKTNTSSTSTSSTVGSTTIMASTTSASTVSTAANTGTTTTTTSSAVTTVSQTAAVTTTASNCGGTTANGTTSC